jgi:hypothetical protein
MQLGDAAPPRLSAREPTADQLEFRGYGFDNANKATSLCRSAVAFGVATVQIRIDDVSHLDQKAQVVSLHISIFT